MDIKPGMMFKGKINGRMIKILKADDVSVVYKDMQHGTVFSVGRKLFENCDLIAIEKNDKA